MRRMPPAMAEMMSVTMLATTRHFPPIRDPEMVSPPERRKRKETQIPKNPNPKANPP